MTLLRRRIVGAVAVLATLALSACAVPGQGEPGIAATYGDRVVTNQQVLDMSQAYEDLGTVSSAPGEPLTMLLLGPDLVAEATRLGMPLTDEKVQTSAEDWIAYNKVGGTVTPAALELVRDLYSLFYLFTSTDGIAVLEKAGTDAAAGVVASPRYGTFTLPQYVQTVNTAYNDAIVGQTSLKGLLFTPFKQVSGFAGASPTWVSGG
jgi:hypothetical protein